MKKVLIGIFSMVFLLTAAFSHVAGVHAAEGTDLESATTTSSDISASPQDPDSSITQSTTTASDTNTQDEEDDNFDADVLAGVIALAIIYGLA